MIRLNPRLTLEAACQYCGNRKRPGLFLLAIRREIDRLAFPHTPFQIRTTEQEEQILEMPAGVKFQTRSELAFICNTPKCRSRASAEGYLRCTGKGNGAIRRNVLANSWPASIGDWKSIQLQHKPPATVTAANFSLHEGIVSMTAFWVSPTL